MLVLVASQNPKATIAPTVLTVAYFDTSAWSHLFKGAVLELSDWQAVATRSDLSVLEQALSAGTLSIPLSVVALEELIAETPDYRPRAKLALDFSDWSRVLKPTEILLTDMVKSYASCGRPASPLFLGTEQWKWPIEFSDMILGESQDHIAERVNILRKARAQIQTFHARMVEGKKSALESSNSIPV